MNYTLLILVAKACLKVANAYSINAKVNFKTAKENFINAKANSKVAKGLFINDNESFNNDIRSFNFAIA